MERRIALITGATSGIGEGCARRFAQGGYDVIITGRNEERLTTVKAACESAGAQVLALPFDVRDRDACEQAVKSLEGEWAQIDVLINNAGLALGLEKEYMGDMDDWETMIDTNVKGLLWMTRLIVPRWWNATTATSSISAVWPVMPHTPEEMFIVPQRQPLKPSLTG